MSRFAQAVARDPSRPAVVDATGTVSRRELAERADRIASALQNKLAQFRPPHRIAFAMDKTWEAIAIVVGCLQAGVAFVPLNPRWPVSRRARILDIARPAFVIGRDDGIGIETIALADLIAHSSERARDFAPSSIAYVIFTSGSTGDPKGVQISRTALDAFARNIERFLDMPDDVGQLAGLAELTFDQSVQDWILMLLGKGALHLLDAASMTSMQLADYVAAQRLTYVSSVGTTFALLVSHGRWVADQLGSLRTVCSGGSTLYSNVARVLLDIMPRAKLFNLFGPTEATVYCAGHEVTAASLGGPTVPIGHPFDDQLLLFDHGTVVTTSPGQEAELLICGTQLMDGYLGVETSFEAVAWQGRQTRAYRSGDLFTGEADAIRFVCRKGGFIKKRGYRVSPAEVEAVFARHPAIAECASVGVPHPIAENTLVLFYVAPEPVDAGALGEFGRQELASYAVPDEFVPIEAIPKSSSQKIDYAALRTLYLARASE
jgi:acyl-CoA synthetase (AMP-forming)/AMP-acid ligase II